MTSTVVQKPVTEAQIDAYRSVFGADYWVEDRDTWRFIGLNSLYVLSGLAGEDAQWAWLEEALTGHDQIERKICSSVRCPNQETYLKR